MEGSEAEDGVAGTENGAGEASTVGDREWRTPGMEERRTESTVKRPSE